MITGTLSWFKILPILSMQHDFTGDGQELAKVEPQKLKSNFFGIWQNLVKNLSWNPLYVNTLSIRDEWK